MCFFTIFAFFSRSNGGVMITDLTRGERGQETFHDFHVIPTSGNIQIYSKDSSFGDNALTGLPWSPWALEDGFVSLSKFQFSISIIFFILSSLGKASIFSILFRSETETIKWDQYAKIEEICEVQILLHCAVHTVIYDDISKDRWHLIVDSKYKRSFVPQYKWLTETLRETNNASPHSRS